jgi:hypothetical protein
LWKRKKTGGNMEREKKRRINDSPKWESNVRE